MSHFQQHDRILLRGGRGGGAERGPPGTHPEGRSLKVVAPLTRVESNSERAWHREEQPEGDGWA